MRTLALTAAVALVVLAVSVIRMETDRVCALFEPLSDITAQELAEYQLGIHGGVSGKPALLSSAITRGALQRHFRILPAESC
jgi:hypothetical protein